MGVRERLRTHSIESSGKLKISPEQHCDFTAEDLKDLGEIGRGAYGSVNKMVHKPSNQIMAVKVKPFAIGLVLALHIFFSGAYMVTSSVQLHFAASHTYGRSVTFKLVGSCLGPETSICKCTQCFHKLGVLDNLAVKKS